MTIGAPYPYLGYIAYIDVATSGTTYYGFAAPGTATSTVGWRIMAMTTASVVESYLFADGVRDFTKVWNSRTSYTYS